jgi:hypothetical protein
MKKNIKENYSFSPTDPIDLVNGSYNISKVSDPVELKRMNNFIQSVLTSAPFAGKHDALNQLRLKLNLIGFDIDLPKTIRDGSPLNATLPLKRFGGITGIDDMAQKLDNPHGPGPKMDIVLTSQDDFLSAKVVPTMQAEAPEAPTAPAQEAPAVEETPEPVKESVSFSEALRRIRRK